MTKRYIWEYGFVLENGTFNAYGYADKKKDAIEAAAELSIEYGNEKADIRKVEVVPPTKSYAREYGYNAF